MSSVPVQLLIYVAPEPYCGEKPIIMPIEGCLEVSVGVSTTFNVTVLNQCDWNYTTITDVVMLKTILGLEADNLIVSSNDPSIVYMTLTWIPQLSQVGAQEICLTAFTE